MVVNWWRETSASLADRVTVRRSSGAAGLGLFAEGDGCSRGPDKVILRIPRGSTFDIHSVDAMIGTEAEYVHGGGVSLALFQRFSKDCWSSFSAAEHLQGLLTETVILTFHFVTLCVGERDGLEIPLRLSRYLNEVLLATTVDNPVVHPLCFAKRYRFHSRFQVYDSLVCQLCRLFSRPAGPLEPSVRQIAAAVMSRCLEIPEQDEHGDYTLNTTLVPLLDYANHSAEPNARFDADAADVVLKLDPMVAEPTEVLISYNDTVEVLDFVLTYGFVPQAATHFNFTIDRDWLLLNHRDMYRFCKWFHINLSFQAVRNTEGWCLSPANLVALNLWFTLGSKLVYEEVGLSTIDDTTSDFVTTREDTPWRSAQHRDHRAFDLNDLDSQGIEEADSIGKLINLIKEFLRYRVKQLQAIEQEHSDSYTFKDLVRTELQVMKEVLSRDAGDIISKERYEDGPPLLPPLIHLA